MPLKNVFVIARSARGRPTLMHRLRDRQTEMTACGVDTREWSRAYSPKPIEAILCKREACRV